jgi:carboxymethylenebutenolidase
MATVNEARTSVTIETQDGRCKSSVFRPASNRGPWPAVIVFMDGLGIRPTLFELAKRIADHGYFVLLPDLFYRAGPYEAPSFAMFSDPPKRAAWMATYISTASHENVRRDTQAFLDFLAMQPDVKQPKVGTTGYCMSGGLSLDAAGNFPDRVAAAASYHGARLASDAPDSPHLLAPHMKARVYVAGAVEDSGFPDDMKQRLEDALTAARVDHIVETYEGARHGWVMPDAPVYNHSAAERHWKTLFALFDATLKN